jgi:hypothetical protein
MTNKDHAVYSTLLHYVTRLLYTVVVIVATVYLKLTLSDVIDYVLCNVLQEALVQDMDPGTDEDAGWENSGDDIYDVSDFKHCLSSIIIVYDCKVA